MSDTCINILSTLIAFDTTTKNDTLAAAEWVNDYFHQLGATSQLIYSSSKKRASVFATIGNPNASGIILSGHMDTVPAVVSDWDTNPWKLTKKGDNLYGRGTTDMKGAVATALSLVPDFIASGKTVHFVLTHDEEISGNGVNEVLNAAGVREILQKSTGCIVMEATDNQAVIGQKQVVIGHINVKGISVHSSDPAKGINALWHATKIYDLFYKTFEPFKQQLDPMYKVPYPVADILQFNAGTAINTIPDSAEMAFSTRFFDAKQQTIFLENLKTNIENYALEHPSVIIEYKQGGALPGFDLTTDNAFVKRIMDVTPLHSESKVSYGTEAGHFANIGVSPVVLGPGNIAQAHAINEFVTETQLNDFTQILKKIIL